MARELGPHGITVDALLPGATETEVGRSDEIRARRRAAVPRQCIPRAQVPEDLVGALRFPVSDASAFMAGQAMVVNGGICHL